MRNDVKNGWVPRGENDELTTRMGTPNQLESFSGYNRKVGRPGHTPIGVMAVQEWSRALQESTTNRGG